MKAGKQQVQYMPEMLQAMWEATGRAFMAVCSAGAALVRPHGGGARFEDLLSRVPTGMELIAAGNCG